MDIVTAGRACVRRWYLFLPILVIGILASVHVANATKPTYQSTGQFIVLGAATQPVTTGTKKVTPPKAAVTPIKGATKGKVGASPTPSVRATPTPTATPSPAPTVTQVNPYAGNLDLLRVALLTQLNGPAFRQQVADAGTKGSFVVSIAKKQPIFTVTSSARHKKNAVDISTAVLAQSNLVVRDIQTTAGAPAGNLQRVQILVSPAGAADVTSGKSKRLVVGVVITVAAALALSIGLDSLVLSIRRRRASRSAETTAAATPEVAPATESRGGRRAAVSGKAAAATPELTSSSSSRSEAPTTGTDADQTDPDDGVGRLLRRGSRN